MKKIIALAVLVAINVTPAFAISHSYRAKLERSGCTQMTDGNGCDINKTKAQNQRAYTNKVPRKVSLDQISSEVDSIIGADAGEAINTLYQEGWRSDGLHEYVKAGWRMRVVIEQGNIANAQIIGH